MYLFLTFKNEDVKNQNIVFKKANNSFSLHISVINLDQVIYIWWIIVNKKLLSVSLCNKSGRTKFYLIKLAIISSFNKESVITLTRWDEGVN